MIPTSASATALETPSSPHNQGTTRTNEDSTTSRFTSLWPSQNPTLAERFHPRIILENSGCVARDHLAGERTFLSYMRTSLALASMGVAVLQLFTISALKTTTPSSGKLRLEKSARPIGAAAVAIAFVILAIGFFRYFAIQTAFIRGVFPVARKGVAFITVALSSLTLVLFVMLLYGGGP